MSSIRRAGPPTFREVCDLVLLVCFFEGINDRFTCDHRSVASRVLE